MYAVRQTAPHIMLFGGIIYFRGEILPLYFIGGDNIMDRYVFAFASVTIAGKAQSVLKRNGVSADIIRTPKNLSVGCGYSVVANGDAQMLSDILEKNGVQPKATGKYNL